MRFVVAGIAALLATGAHANECLSPGIKHDVCADALEMQRNLAGSLPMAINANMTLHSVMAIGPRVVFNVIWTQTSLELEAAMRASGTSADDLRRQIEEFARTQVCERRTSSAFIGLGGQVQYIYSTSDKRPVTDAVVSDCPPAT